VTSQEAGPHRQDVVTDDHWDTLRRRAFAVAYRMLGAVGDAEDVAQEAVLRLSRLPDAPVEPAAWVTTVATRLALDELRRARRRREAYVGPWLPEPLLDAPDPAPGPAERAELADSLSLAFLVLLERLTPAERAAFLLREVFSEDYARIADHPARRPRAHRGAAAQQPLPAARGIDRCTTTPARLLRRGAPRPRRRPGRPARRAGHHPDGG
jgi:RNA polymerase sigma factor (sigma-70 family)